jgi:hypothetical protein
LLVAVVDSVWRSGVTGCGNFGRRPGGVMARVDARWH